METDGEPGSDLEQRFRALTVIWLALTLGVVMFTGVVFGIITLGVFDAPQGPVGPDLMPVVVSLSVLVMAAGLLVGRRVGAAPRHADVEERLNRYHIGRVVALATAEFAALSAGVLGLLAGAGTWVIVAGAAAVWVMVLARPRKGDIDRFPR